MYVRVYLFKVKIMMEIENERKKSERIFFYIKNYRKAFIVTKLSMRMCKRECDITGPFGTSFFFWLFGLK